ncbi:MAG TPA: hypothetical protein VJN67_08890 [Stellaceae bacterium]|nr:hypothetical protein [Stellaceae bacterium]
MGADGTRSTQPKETAADGLVGKMRRLLWGSGGKAPDVVVAPAARKTLAWKQASGADADEAEFLGQVRRMLQQTPSLQASRLNIIGLKRVKEHFGDEWKRIADRADRIARNVIERHLNPGDIYANWGVDTYITVFARLSEQEARVKCYLIGNEIVRTLLGDDASEFLEVKTAVSRVDGSIDLKTVGSLQQVFDGAEVISPLAPPPESSSAPPAPATTPRDTTAALAAETGHAFVPIEREKRAAAAPVAAGSQNAPAVNVLAGVDFVFRPMWDPTRNVIATYRCVPQVKLSNVNGAAGDASLAVAGDPEATAQLDRTTLARVKSDLKAMAADGRRLIIAMPLHFETLCSAAQRRRISAELGAIAESMKQYLVVEIVGVPTGFLKSRLMEVIAPLRMHCRAVSLQVSIGTIDFTQVRGTGISAVGADIADLAKSEAVVMQQLSRFQRAAEKAEVVTFLHGAQSRSLAAAAVGAGFHYVDGDGVAATLNRPERIVPFQLADLYAPR